MAEQETCDCCGKAVKASNLIRKDLLMLSFCNHHTNRFFEKLTTQGWVITPI